MRDEIDVIKRKRRAGLRVECLREVLDAEDDIARFQSIETRAHLGRLIAMGRQGAREDQLVHGIGLMPL
jgi:hypothetical protein